MPTNDHDPDVTLGVLAGGAGRRLGGVDKGLARAGGRALIEHVLARLAPDLAGTLIGANRNRQAYASLGASVYPDELGDEAWPGPLAAVITLLRHCPTPWLQIAPCDAPLLPTNLPTRLRASVAQQAAAVPYADGRSQWACALLARHALPALEQAFADGVRSLGGGIATLSYAPVAFEGRADTFANINTPDELARLEHRLAPG